MLGSIFVLGAEPSPSSEQRPEASATEDPPPIIPSEGSPKPPEAPGIPSEPGAPDSVPPLVDPQVMPDNLPVLVDPASRLDAHPSTRPQLRPAPRPLVDEEPSEDAAEIEVGVYDLSVPTDPSLQPLPELAAYSIEDPLARTVLSNARGLADSLYDGLGGVPRPLDFPFLPKLAFPGGRTFRFGPVVYSPSVGAEAVFSKSDDRRGPADIETARANLNANIFAGIGDPEVGRFLTLDYGASQTFGLNRSTDNHLDQRLFLVGQLQFVKLRLGMGVEIESLSGYNRDVGGQVERDFITFALTSTYQLTPKTSFDWDLTTPSGRFPGGGASGLAGGDSSGFTSTNFINYQYSPKTHLGLGFTAGYVEIDGAETQTYQQVLVRHGSTPTPFLSYSAALGVEFRDTGGLTRTHPVFVVGAVWTPRPRTTLKISGQQRIENSASTLNANYVTTTFALSFRQLLGERSALFMSAGFENAKYESTRPGDSVHRRDRTYLGQISLSTNVAERLDLALTLTAARSVSQGSPTIFTQCALQAWFRF